MLPTTAQIVDEVASHPRGARTLEDVARDLRQAQRDIDTYSLELDRLYSGCRDTWAAIRSATRDHVRLQGELRRLAEA